MLHVYLPGDFALDVAGDLPCRPPALAGGGGEGERFIKGPPEGSRLLCGEAADPALSGLVGLTMVIP